MNIVSSVQVLHKTFLPDVFSAQRRTDSCRVCYGGRKSLRCRSMGKHARWIGILLLISVSQSICTEPLKERGSAQDQVTNSEAPAAPMTGSPHPGSLFDAVSGRFNPVKVDVEVKSDENRVDSSGSRPVVVSGEEIIVAAGSYADMMRYLQVIPGVVATSDTNNEVFVRGGHPIENLYIVDGFEVPNINHLARLGSTGGFAPMIDSALVQRMRFLSGGYGTQFSDHLSSITELDLLDAQDRTGHAEVDLGIQGVGGLLQTTARKADLLVSGHHGLLDAVTRDAGMSGVPSYTNELSRVTMRRPSGDSFTLLNIAGWDSIEVTPCESDWEETSSINSQYSGKRTTTGLRWQKLLSSKSFATFSITDSEQIQQVHQQDQFLDPRKARLTKAMCPLPKNYVVTTPVYLEDTNYGSTAGSMQYEWASASFSFSAGATGWLQRPHFDIHQPVGVFSPYSSTSVRSDGTSISTDFNVGETGSYLALSYRLRNLSVNWGSRLQTFAFGNHTTLSSRASARYKLGEHAQLRGAFATYAQLPPYIYLVSFPQNRSLLPMRAEHWIVGLDLDVIPGSQTHIEAYHKPYSDIPAATEYPAVTLHSIPDQLGDEIVWLPLNSTGSGRASGIELSNTTRIDSKVLIKSSLAYASAKFAGVDGVYRASNFDLPWMFNMLSTFTVTKGFGASARFGFATGRPYTPYDMAASVAQNRPIYDLSRVNSARAASYARLDVQANKDILIRHQHVQLYAGVDNVLNRDNFLTFAWMPLAHYHRADPNPVRQVYQMPIFPNFGIRWIVR